MLLPCILYCDTGPGCLMRTAFKYIIGLLIREIIFSFICPLRLFFGDAAVYPQESYTFVYRLYVSRARCIGLFKSFVCSGSILYKYSCLHPSRWSSSALEGSPSRRRETPISNQLVLQVVGHRANNPIPKKKSYVKETSIEEIDTTGRDGLP